MAIERPDWFDEILVRMPNQETGFLRRYYALLVRALAVELDHRLAEGLRSRHASIRESVLCDLQWCRKAPGPETVEAFQSLLNLEDSKAPAFVASMDVISQGLRESESWFWDCVDQVPIERLSSRQLRHLIRGLVSGAQYDRGRLNTPLLKRLFRRLRRRRDLGSNPFPAFLNAAAELQSRMVFKFLKKRVERFESMGPRAEDSSFRPLFYTLERRIFLPHLSEEPDFPEIAADLLNHMRKPDGPAAVYWELLFQAVILPHEVGCKLLQTWIQDTDEFPDLRRIVGLIHYQGSTMIFRYPDLIRALLEKIGKLPRKDRKLLEARLHRSADARSYSNGEMDAEHGYFLAEAEKAVAKHANDPVLRPFYEAVIAEEKRDRELFRQHYRNEPAEEE